jgi:hypothetical protein
MTHPNSPSSSEHNPFPGRPINGSLLLKVSEAAAALRILRSSIYRLFESVIRQGDGTAGLPGGRDRLFGSGCMIWRLWGGVN